MAIREETIMDFEFTKKLDAPSETQNVIHPKTGLIVKAEFAKYTFTPSDNRLSPKVKMIQTNCSDADVWTYKCEAQSDVLREWFAELGIDIKKAYWDENAKKIKQRIHLEYGV